MNQTVTYIIRHRDMPIYITNKPTDNNSDVSYSTNRNRAREFNGMEEASINIQYQQCVKS
ncbi:TPA: DUF2483 family protein [Staphylococcus aureus]|nr:DUF2483 family protein [Staphylococcus aureus]HCT1239642.1 DUF2483 family protein [Staphylococcus aureus]HCU0380039.1 DUF2483 family protein [Staphylococcus aureus]HCU0426790.1 DUF2483 family protein [Staphylococcus aureus]HCX1205459.1 DUF2483 family protein [Staphylococcus aureus]